MKHLVLFSCLLGLSVEAVTVDPNQFHPYPQGLSSLQKAEVRGKLKKVENEKKLEEPDSKGTALYYDQREDKKELYDDKNDRGFYGQGFKDQKAKEYVRDIKFEGYKNGRRYEGRHREQWYKGRYESKDRRYRNEGYGGIGYKLEEFSKDGRRYGDGYDYGLDYYLKNGRYNDGYGKGIVLEDSKDLYRRYKNERDRDYYVGYAGYGVLPDYKDRKYKNEEYGEKFYGRGERYGYDQKDRRYKNEEYDVGFVFEDPKQYEGYNGYLGIGYKNFELDKFNKGYLNIGYNDGYYNRGYDKYRDVYGYGYKDGYGYDEEGYDKIKNYRRYRDRL